MVNCRIESMYLCVNDMDRAVSFMNSFLNKEWQKKMKYIVFLILMVSVLVYLLIKKWMKNIYLAVIVYLVLSFLNKEVLKSKNQLL